MKGRSIAYFISSLAILLALLLIACPATAQNVKSKSVGPPSQIPDRKITAPPNRKPPIRSAAGSIAVNENPLYYNYTPEQLVKNVLITGCLTASNIQFQGLFNPTNVNERQLGYFEKATSNFPINEGLILSSGYVTAAEGPNNSTNNSQNLNRAGDPNLTAIAGVATHDAAVLQFDFVPAGNTLEFQYIFSSEEYLEWCCSPYNDAFGFFLTGPGVPGTVNLALIPATAIPVTINNVHQYTANGYNNQPCAAQNAAYYVNNPPGTLSTQFDGMTVVLTATYPVTPCSTYHIKLAVGDAQDYVYNSAVFLKARSFNSEAVGATNVNVNVDIPDFSNIFEGCPANHFILERDPAYISQPVTVYILYGGTATNGVDVVTFPGPPNPLPTVVNIPAGVSSYDISYIAVDDGPGDAGEKLDIQILQSCPCDPNPVYLTKTLTIYEQDLTIAATGNNVDCGSGSSGSITVNALHGSGDNLFSIDGGNTWQTANLFTNLAPDDYTILAKNVGSCGTTSTTVTVGAPNPIVAGAGPDGTICSGESYQLNGTGGTVYSWSPQTGLSDPEIPNPFASPTVTTTYTVTVSDIGCTPSTDEVTVYVNPSPVIGITPFNRNICIGSSITLTASGGGTYLWNLVPAETTQSITKTPLTSTSYTVIVTGPNGCKADSTANVVVHPLPTAVLSGDATICSGVQATLTVILTGTAPWHITYLEGLIPHNEIAYTPVFSFQVPPLTTTTYTLQSVTDLWGCAATNLSGSAIVTVTQLPTPPTFVSVDNNNFCPNAFANITLSASGGTGTSVNWYRGSCPGGTLVGTVSSVNIPSPIATTTYYARNMNSCGGSACIPITVTILTAPTAPLTITTTPNPTSYCIGSTMPHLPYELTANGSSNVTGYEWFQDVGCGVGTPMATIMGSNILTLSAPPASTTTYVVRAINTNCKASNCTSITITVFSPSVGGTVASNATVCSGTNTGTLVLSGNTGNVLRWESSINGGSNWSNISNTTTSQSYNNITQTTMYRAIVQSGTGSYACTAVPSSSVTITVTPLPVPTISGPAAACINSTTNTYTTEAGMSNYVWSVSAGGTITAGGNALSNTATVTWNTSGPQTVSVNYTNGNNCTAAAPTVYNVTVNPLPVPALSGPTPVCLNSTGNVYITDPGMNNYVWTVGSGGTITAGGGVSNNTATITWSTTGPHTISVSYTNGTNCTAAAATIFNVTVNPLPVITLAGPSSVCINSTGNVYTTEAGMTNYIWAVSAGGTITAGGTAANNTVTVTWNTAGPRTVSVNYTNGANCTAASPTVFNITVNPLPIVTMSGPAFVCRNIPGNVYTTEPGMSNYVWTYTGTGRNTTAGGNSTSNTATITWTLPGAKTVTVSYTNANGCTGLAATISVTAQVAPVAPVSLTSPTSTTYCANSAPINYTIFANNGIDPINTALAAVPGLTYEWFKDVGCGVGAPVAVTNQNFLFLSPAPSATTTYWARTSNSCGVSSCANIAITVNRPPAITAQPVSQSVCPGTSVTFNVTADPTVIPAPTYQWRKGGVNIGGATSSAYTINNVGTGDAGNYDVVLTNTCAPSGVISSVAALTVKAAPTITAPASLCVNTTANLTPSSGGTWTSSDPTKATVNVVGLITALSAGNVTFTFNETASGCSSTTSSVIVNPLASTPINVTASPSTITYGQSAVLSATVGVGETVDWYMGSCSGSPIAGGTGVSSVTVSPIATTTYYARARNTTTGCVSACTMVVVNVLPACPADFAVCNNAAPVLLNTATPAGGSYFGDGVTGSIATGFTFNPVTAGVGSHLITYSLLNQLVAYWNFNDGFVSPRAWNAPIPADAGSGSGSITAGTWTWGSTSYTDHFAGSLMNVISPAAAGASLSLIRGPDATSMNGKYIQVQVNMTGLANLIISYWTNRSSNFGFTSNQWSWSTDNITYTNFGPIINPTDAGSVITLSAPASLNGAPTVFLRYTLNGATPGVTYIAVNNRIDNLQLNASPTESLPCTFNITVNNSPAAPTNPGNQSVCVDSPIPTLTATATAPPGATLVWYDAATGGNIVANPILNNFGSITYYAASSANGCLSAARTPVTLTIENLPVVSCPANSSVCLNDLPITLSGATPVGGVYSGPGVTAGIFTPASAGLGSHSITYTYQNTSQLVAYWNFNGLSIAAASPPGSGGVPTSISSDQGSGNISLTGWTGLVDDFAGTTINTLNSDLAGASLSLTSNVGNGSFIQIQSSLIGLTNPIISFSTRGTSTGYNSGIWSYSVDGTNFTALGVNTATTGTTFVLKTADFSGISALINAPIAYFRYTLSGASDASGNNRIDNLQLRAGNLCSNSCNYSITVNPSPVVPAQTSIICSGTSPNFTPTNNPPTTIVPAGTTYTWTTPVSNPLGAITGGSQQTTGVGAVNQILTNSTNAIATLTYTVTPSAGSCPGTPFALTVTVNPKPAVNNLAATICSAGTFTVSPVNGTEGIVPAGTTYSWLAPSVAGISGTTPGTNAANISGTLTNTTNAAINVIYTVTPVSGSCTGNTFTVTVTVNPLSVAPTSASSDRTMICSNATGNIVLAATGGSGTTLRWSATCHGTSVGSGNNLSIPVPTVTTTYYAWWENSCGNSDCTPVTVTVLALPPLPTLTPDPACEGTAAFVAGGGTIYEFTVDGVVQQAASTNNIFTPATAPAAGKTVCVNSYPAPPFIINGDLSEPAWGAPLATNAGGADPYASFGMGNILNAIYIQADKAFLYGGIAGNLDGENRILLFIDSKPGVGINNLSTIPSKLNIYDYSVEKLNPGITFDAGFTADYILIINKVTSTGLVYYDIYSIADDKKYPQGTSGSLLLGYQGAPNNTNLKLGFEFALPLSLIGSPGGSINVFGMIVNNPGPTNPTTLLSNQFLTKANAGENNYGYGAVNFGNENPNPITVTLNYENCSSQKCVTIQQTPTTSAIYHQ